MRHWQHRSHSSIPRTPVSTDLSSPCVTKTELAPAAPRERLVVLDALRGFALLGVLIGNTFRLYTGSFVTPPALRGTPTAWDTGAMWFVNVLVQSKAQTLLTFLFGFGFAAQLIRAEERDQPVMGMYLRRILALLGFGVLHVCLLWWGDVLWTYAVAALGLLVFLPASNRTRIVAAIVCCFVPEMVTSLPGVMDWFYGWFFAPGTRQTYFSQLHEVIRHGSYVDSVTAHMRFAVVFSAGGWAGYELWLVGRFLFGYVAGARHWFDRDGADHLVVFRRLRLWGGLVGLAGTVSAMLLWGLHKGQKPPLALSLLGHFARELDFLGLCAFYMGTLVLLMQRPRWRKLLGVVVPAGRMPLTVYLSQSLIMTSLLYGWGLGWGAVISPFGSLMLSFVVFAVQVALCHLWLARFRYGPLEWLWRAAVYRRAP
jgi:uncharacterized protein